MRNDNKARDIFYGVIAIATLIVALVGATLSYFIVSDSSEEGVVNATADIVSIEYNDGTQVTAQATKLIPSTLDIVKKVYEKNIKSLGTDEVEIKGNACTDTNSKEICSAYRFTIRSDKEREITALLKNEHNGFTYLSYAVYDVTNGKWLKLNGNKESLAMLSCSNEEDETSTPVQDCYSEGTVKTYEDRAVNSIFGLDTNSLEKKPVSLTVSDETQIYDLVLFIEENNQNQNIDQGQNYRGTIVVDVVGLEGQITGKAD